MLARMVDRVSTAFEKLTPREREILRLIAAHLQSKEIARALGLSPKTVEMHVLSARRRLSGMSRRDAALAFVAWEGGDPGSDYRKQPDDLAALPDTPPSDREIGNIHGRKTSTISDVRPSPAQGSGSWSAALRDLVAGPDGDVPAGTSTARRDWRHELTNLQWLGLVLGITVLIAVSLAVIAISVHEFILAIQRITHR
ncbi:helix-turn-helix transcriptional regulator [Caulobacter sp.]|uniref:helix-turn-helix domain-containing protein n=1 Tax=Caulobacter sp. TaxID=78 RepID=UPI001B2A5E5A|nr:helix-turn-helix transcriptional regulator [Caulobacter sp.]MBO9545198.1 helix-turn-helix transcriptional regulator [Caulobacter sp.]